jgi:hypothetical protein
MAQRTERIVEQQRAYYLAHREEIRTQRQERYASNREQICAKERARRAARLTGNPGAVKQLNRETYLRRRDAVISQQNARYAAKKETILAQRQIRYATDPRYKMIAASKDRAIKCGVPHTITKDDIVIPSHCPIFGIPLVVAKGTPTDNSPSLDRIVPKLGYVRENIIVISWRANSIKRNATVAELRALANFYSVRGVA